MAIQEITPVEAESCLEDFKIVDVREAHEYHGPLGHIESADHIPLRRIGEEAERLAGTGPLLLVCRSGIRSGKACTTLNALGAGDVTNLVGGMIAWKKAELTVAETKPVTGAALVDSIVSWEAQVGPLSPVEAQAKASAILAESGSTRDAPDSAAVTALIDAVETSLAEAAPPDLAPSMASFRRWLAGL